VEHLPRSGNKYRMIPDSQISKEPVLAAISQIDSQGVPPQRASTKFEIAFNSKRYSPKYVVSMAAKLATGKELLPNEFSGGEETNASLRRLGFDVLPRGAPQYSAKARVHFASVYISALE